MKRILATLLIFLFSTAPVLAATTTFLESGSDATQDLSFYNTVNVGSTSATDQSHTGPRSVKSSTGAGPANGFVRTPAAILADSGSQISVWFRYDTAPAAASAFVSAQSVAGAGIFNVGLNTNGTLILTPVGITGVSGTTVLAANTWYRISLSYYITNTTTWAAKVYINGGQEISMNVGTLAVVNASLVQFGYNLGAGANRNSWVDDIYVATGGASSASQPDTGDIRVTAKRPFANGTLNEWTTQIGSGGSGYGSGHAPQVNERPLSTTNGWSIQNVAKKVEEYTIESSDQGDVNITGFPIVDYTGWVLKKTSATTTGNIIVNGVATGITVGTFYATTTQKAAGSTVYPTGGAAVGMDTNTVNQLFSLAETGILIAYRPIPQSFKYILGSPFKFIFRTGFKYIFR